MRAEFLRDTRLRTGKRRSPHASVLTGRLRGPIEPDVRNLKLGWACAAGFKLLRDDAESGSAVLRIILPIRLAITTLRDAGFRVTGPMTVE